LDNDGAGHIASHAEEQLVTDFAPVAGVRWDPTPRWKLGAVFRGRSRSRYEIRVDSNLQSVVGFDLPKLAVVGASQYDPLQAAVEAACRPTPAWRGVAQLNYQHGPRSAPPTEPAAWPAGTPEHPRCGAQVENPGASCFGDRVIPRVAAEWRRVGGVVETAV